MMCWGARCWSEVGFGRSCYCYSYFCGRCTNPINDDKEYCKQQIPHGTKLSRIFDKMQKFSLLISMARSNMYCNLINHDTFPYILLKNQWTVKVLYCRGFVVYGILFCVTAVWFGTIIDVWTLRNNPNLSIGFAVPVTKSSYAVTDDLTTYVCTCGV